MFWSPTQTLLFGVLHCWETRDLWYEGWNQRWLLAVQGTSATPEPSLHQCGTHKPLFLSKTCTSVWRQLIEGTWQTAGGKEDFRVLHKSMFISPTSPEEAILWKGQNAFNSHCSIQCRSTRFSTTWELITGLEVVSHYFSLKKSPREPFSTYIYSFYLYIKYIYFNIYIQVSK